MRRHCVSVAGVLACLLICCSTLAIAQTPPDERDISGYSGLHAAAHHGEAETIQNLAAAGPISKRGTRPDVHRCMWRRLLRKRMRCARLLKLVRT